MKRRETNGGWEDRLSGIMPDPERLSAVSRSTLARAGARWLSFARARTRGRGRTSMTADTRAFIESLYGARYRTVEGGAFPLDKVYRTAGGGLFVSETRLSVSVQPRFDLRLLNVAGVRVASQILRESHATTLLSHAGVGGRERQRDVRHITNSAAAPSLTVQTWNVLPSGAERVPPAFGYVRVRRAQQGQGTEPARPAARVERPVRDGRAAETGAETSRPNVAHAPASLQLTSLDLRQFVTHTPRQEFVSLLLNTYLPAVVSREILSTRTAGASSGTHARAATSEGATQRRFAPSHVTPGRRPAAWTYAEPAPRRAPGGGVERHGESRSVETVREHAASRDPLPSLLHVLPPASLLLSLSEVSTTAAGHTTYRSGGHTDAPSLQLLRTHTAAPGTRERTAAARAPHLFDRTPQPQTTGTRDVLTSLHTFAEHLHTNVAGMTRDGGSTFFTRADFIRTLRRGFEQVPTRQRVTTRETATRDAAADQATARDLFGRPVELVRPASVAQAERAAAARDAGAQLSHVGARSDFSTRGAPGAGTFLFTKTLLRRSEGGSAAMSPTGAMSPRLATAAETERAVSETRAARPEGMALEVVRQRRESVLQLPRPGYVFTQPARAQLEERQVITKASREEIVEVVRKEVRSLAAAAPVSPAPSRAELAGIADEVYSTLVRRLMVEKERLGRF